MVIDTSAIVAILLGEPEAEDLVAAIAAAEERVIGAPTLVEAAAILFARKGTAGEVALDALLQRLEIEVVPMTADAACSQPASASPTRSTLPSSVTYESRVLPSAISVQRPSLSSSR